jgi:hypothetical protein
MTGDEWRTLAAVWGAVTGTISITLATVIFFRDRARLKLRLTTHTEEEARSIRRELVHTGGQRYVFLEVVNAGRRIRYIYQPELWVAEGNLMFIDEVDTIFTDGTWRDPEHPWKPWRLEEGQSITFVFTFREKHRLIRADVPDSLAHRYIYPPISGRLHWLYCRSRQPENWRELRDALIERNRTRHHDRD